MANEEDTFRALRMHPYEEVKVALNEWLNGKASNYTLQETNEFLRPYGWTWSQYMEQRIQILTASFKV
jgi:hypothetical protein